MKITIDVNGFMNKFLRMGRAEQFSYNGFHALFDYLESTEDCTDNEIELDVIALCCEYCEYENFEEIKKEYSNYFDNNNIQCLEDLEKYITVINFDGGIIIQSF